MSRGDHAHEPVADHDEAGRRSPADADLPGPVKAAAAEHDLRAAAGGPGAGLNPPDDRAVEHGPSIQWLEHHRAVLPGPRAAAATTASARVVGRVTMKPDRPAGQPVVSVVDVRAARTAPGPVAGAAVTGRRAEVGGIGDGVASAGVTARGSAAGSATAARDDEDTQAGHRARRAPGPRAAGCAPGADIDAEHLAGLHGDERDRASAVTPGPTPAAAASGSPCGDPDGPDAVGHEV